MEYFPGFTTLEILQKIHEDLHVRRINPEQFEGTLMSSFNDNGQTKERNFFRMFFEIREGKGVRNKVSARTLVILRSRRRQQMAWNAHLQT